ncbi:MAG: YfcE family phosphodiesterase [Ruminococcus sp.]|nr:YfcE family phosphodiesterase [Ruminococcus sp.]
MSRIVVFSDTHGNLAAAAKILQMNSGCDHFVFLGDGIEEINVIKETYPTKKFYCVSGNCDKCDIPTSDVIELFGHKLFLTHGHLFNVRDSLDQLIEAAKGEGVSFLLFGHTHRRWLSKEDGIYILNPGSASQPKDGLLPSYAFIEFSAYETTCIHVDLE